MRTPRQAFALLWPLLCLPLAPPLRATLPDSAAVDSAATLDTAAFGNRVRAGKCRQLAALMRELAAREAAADSPEAKALDMEAAAARLGLADLLARLATAYEAGDIPKVNALAKEKLAVDSHLKALVARRAAVAKAQAFARRPGLRPGLAEEFRALCLRKAELQTQLDKLGRELDAVNQSLAAAERSTPVPPAPGGGLEGGKSA